MSGFTFQLLYTWKNGSQYPPNRSWFETQQGNTGNWKWKNKRNSKLYTFMFSDKHNYTFYIRYTQHALLSHMNWQVVVILHLVTLEDGIHVYQATQKFGIQASCLLVSAWLHEVYRTIIQDVGIWYQTLAHYSTTSNSEWN